VITTSALSTGLSAPPPGLKPAPELVNDVLRQVSSMSCDTRAPWRNRTSINRLKAGCSAVELKGLGRIVGGAPGVISGTIV
jgi:hypothetical protein